MPSDWTGSVLIDTNVLVYAVDHRERGKSRHASEVLEAIAKLRAGVINSQIVTEFYAVTTKLRPGGSALDAVSAARWVDRWLAMFDFRLITEMISREAVRGAKDHQMNIYDAQVWAAAKLGDIGVVLTEDMPSSDLLEGVRYVDPFAANFKLAHLGL